MPSKSFLISLGSTEAVLAYAVEHLGVAPVIHHIKVLPDGQKEVCVCNPDGSNECDGQGDTKLQAIAECVSVNYPVNVYPDPE